MPPMAEQEEQNVDTPEVPASEEQGVMEEVGTDFSDMLDLADEVSASVEEPPTEEAPAEETPEETPPASQESEPNPEETPPAEEVQDDPTPEEPEEPTPPVEEPPAEEVNEQPSLEEVKAKWQDELQEQYKLSEEDADLFLTEPEKVVPKLAANIHAQITEQLLKTVAQMMPQYLQGAIQAQPQLVSGAVDQANAAQAAENQFFTAFPELKAHASRVVEVAKFVKAAPENQKLSSEELMVKIGNAARAVLGVQAPAQNTPPAETPPQPFTPAKPGGSSMAETPAESKSEWDDIIETELI